MSEFKVDQGKLYEFMRDYTEWITCEQIEEFIEHKSQLWREDGIDRDTIERHYLPLAINERTLEKHALEERKRRYDDSVNKAVATGADLVKVKHGSSIVFANYLHGIALWIEEKTTDGRRGRPIAGLSVLRSILEHEIFQKQTGKDKTIRYVSTSLAYVALQAGMNGCYHKHTRQTVIKAMGSAAFNQCRDILFELDKPGIYWCIKKLNKGLPKQAQGLRSMLFRSGNYNLRCTMDDTIAIGGLLMNAICSVKFKDNEPLFEKRALNQRQEIIDLHPKMKQRITKAEHRQLALHPIYKPMVVPPQNWTSRQDGGYWETQLPLFKQSPHIKLQEQIDKHWDDCDKTRVYKAINTAQRSQWDINTKVARVYFKLLGSGKAGLPDEKQLKVRLETELGPCPWGEEMDYESTLEKYPDKVHEYCGKKKSLLKQYMKEKQKAHKARQRQEVTVKFMNRFENQPIYFSYYYDWRGRLYPRSLYLHPQESEDGKALLKFAKGYPLGEGNGPYWFRVGMANAAGEDKISFDERSDWVLSHHDEIIACAQNPSRNDWWMSLDKPFMFLAYAFEYLEWQTDPDNFKSHLPIMLDGSCNALQWLSALSGDADVGEKGNLINSDKPQDFYDYMADVLIELNNVNLENDIDKTAELAEAWNGKIDRSIIKVPAMTSNYNSTFRTQQEYIEDKLAELDWDLPSGERYLNGDISNQEAASYLERMLWDALKTSAPGPSALKDWFRDVAKIFTEEGKFIRWTTPIRFLVIQARYKIKGQVIDTLQGGARYQLTYQEETEELSLSGMKNAFSPNAIHSMDSAHLMFTVLKCAEYGIKDFALIHDSIGVPACQIEGLRQILWYMFCNMIETDIMERLRNELQEQVETELPSLPEKGELKLNPDVVSEYFFG